MAGDADIFLVPSITAGNLLGKALYGLAGGKMAGLVLGASVPITVNSRGAAPEEKIRLHPHRCRHGPVRAGQYQIQEATIMAHRLLILNPGSTSTKAAVYDGAPARRP